LTIHLDIRSEATVQTVGTTKEEEDDLMLLEHRDLETKAYLLMQIFANPWSYVPEKHRRGVKCSAGAVNTQLPFPPQNPKK
jgi:hypothetical protein